MSRVLYNLRRDHQGRDAMAEGQVNWRLASGAARALAQAEAEAAKARACERHH